MVFFLVFFPVMAKEKQSAGTSWMCCGAGENDCEIVQAAARWAPGGRLPALAGASEMNGEVHGVLGRCPFGFQTSTCRGVSG